MISVEDALARVLALGTALPNEVVALRQANGRVLAEPAEAGLDQPPFDASAMDGYAITDADHRPGVRLRVIGEAAAGHAFEGAVQPGTAARIFTGAPVPEGAERVVLQENVTRDGDLFTLNDTEPQRHIRPRGQDFHKGQTMAAPRRLGPRDLSLLASMNVAEVRVSRRPVVAVISTGDELVQPGETPGPDQIIASAGLAIVTMAEDCGAEARLLPIARDTESSLRQSFALAEGADVIVTIGGASVGDHDLVGRVTEDLGMERAFWKIAMRPGKPLMAGRLRRAVLLGLPGNPVSAHVCATLFLRPLLAALQGLPGVHDLRRAELACDMPANGVRTHFMRASLERNVFPPRIRPFDRQDSALMTELSQADALLVRPADDPARKAGEVVPWMPL
jgi:molybdopterin molybdotransferase